MSGRSDSYYRPRLRGGRGKRGEPQNDAIVTALTIQILMCLLVLIGANIIKKVDETAYGGFKGQYTIMTTGSGSAGFGGLTELLRGDEGFFAGVERIISDIAGRFTGSAPPPKEVEDAPQPGAETETGSFRYNYLDIEDDLAQAGIGGMYPVGAGGVEQMAAPDGATLAPIALGAIAKPPVTGLVTSQYAYRIHPISGNTDFHNGIDIAAEEGRAVLAALPGEVVEVVLDDEIYGNYIVLQHATNLQTFYAHCSEIIAAEGMAVRQGERIAKVGQTGTATGPHLHFSVIVEDTFADPLYILGDNIQVIE